jgi:hypothetical protein
VDKTQVTVHRAHKLNKFPVLSALSPKPVLDAATGVMISLTFKKHIEQSRKDVVG